MSILIAIGLPLMIWLGVFVLFWRDLKHFQEREKLKVGELQALVQRHRIAVMLHFALLLLSLPIMIFILGDFALIGAILLAAVFLGHVTALKRMSRPLIAALRYHNQEAEAALEQRDDVEAADFEAEIKQARKRLK